jgi:hypothetical protein
MKNFLKKHTYQIIGVIIVLIGLWLIKHNQPNISSNPTPMPIDAKLDTTQSKPEELTGLLKLSDNTQRGNLMLETTKEKIYLFTGRDYSKLLNTQVVLKINGTLENFSLIDIIAK